jgi:cell division protein FtsI (penicillin-binding protein 3)
MDINNGNIISIVSLPDFNLNIRKSIKDDNYINKVTKGSYEFGSVFKVFTFAAGLNEGVIETNTEFLDLPKSITCAGFPIREYNKKIPSNLTAEEILIRSGNIGSVRIAQKLGIKKFKSFLENIGVLSQIKFDIEEVAPQQKFSWGKCKLATASFGHGITTTILQLAKGYSIIANGGFEINPTLIKKDKKKLVKRKRLLKEGISGKVVPVLRKIVSTKEGTAEQANVKGYEIGGKTGTAEQVIDGTYSRTKINTFASIFPTNMPKYVFIVMLESPKTASKYVYEYRNQPGKTQTGSPYNTAGWTSVEVAGKIIERIGPILATKYIEN